MQEEVVPGPRVRALPVAIAIIAATIILRLSVLPFAIGRSLTGDPASYTNIANNIMTGDGMVRDYEMVTGGLRAYYPPLYPLVMAATGALTPPALLVLNLAIDLATAGAMLWLARLTQMRPAVGLAAASLYLLWPTNIIMASVPYKEGLGALLTVIAFCFLVRRRALGFGIASGLLALTQPALATLPVVAGVLLRWRQGWLRTMLIAMGFAVLVLVPWWVRNFLVFDRFVPLTTGSGGNFWLGTTPLSDGVRWIPEAARHVQGIEPDMTGPAARETLAWIRDQPLDYISHTANKAALMLPPDSWGATPLHWLPPVLYASPAVHVLLAVTSVLLFVLALAGIIRMWREPLAKAAAACLVQLFAFQIWFQFSERHRYFMVPILLLVAAEFGRRMFQEAVTRSSKSSPAR